MHELNITELIYESHLIPLKTLERIIQISAGNQDSSETTAFGDINLFCFEITIN
jgi:hypothetical protein